MADIEILGAFSIVTLKAGGSALRAILRGAPAFALGQVVTLDIPAEAMLVFDNDGRRLR
jgi:ABC-type sugar transport system ATPase subunit